jgi:DNA-binding NtrC family response regulator
MMPYSIFVVDDESVARNGLSLALKKKNFNISAFEAAEPALEAMEKERPDLVLLDIGLAGMSGVDALREIKSRYPEIIVIMITAYEDVKTVVSAMKFGAYEYVVKPVQMDSLLVILQNAFETISMRKEIQSLHEKYLNENMPCFIGASNAILDVMEVVKKVAQSPDTSILIEGQTGTGKELIANAIHFRSPNFKGPLVPVNCAAMPRELLESELFGYEKGAFSGADKSGKMGMVEKAADGTLFLDEIGDLSPEAQAKLLRFLESGEYYKVGGTKRLSIRTRVISATNKNLSRMVDEGSFRQDLYYRLAVVKIEVPSLNQRRDDIIPIAKHFLVKLSKRFNKPFTSIAPETEAALKHFNWTGNVRELKNLIERGVLLEDGPQLKLLSLGACHNSRDGSNPQKNEDRLPSISPTGIDFPSVIEAIEKDYIEEALQLSNGNESKAAQLLNISRDKFRYRRQKLSLPNIVS